MSRNFIDLEREMIDDLERRTGRSLSDWMAMIDAAGLHGKNAVIDWLRPQGFTFANASWLERIHNNSGRPIYLDQAETTRQRTPQTATPRAPSLPPATLAAVEPPPAPAIPETPVPPVPPANPRSDPLTAAPEVTDRLAATLARGKAYRPLAQMLLDTLRHALPDLRLEPDGDIVRLHHPRQFAALLVTPKELRLALELADKRPDTRQLKARMSGATTGLDPVIVLTDARQIGPELIARVVHAAQLADHTPPAS